MLAKLIKCKLHELAAKTFFFFVIPKAYRRCSRFIAFGTAVELLDSLHDNILTVDKWYSRTHMENIRELFGGNQALINILESFFKISWVKCKILEKENMGSFLG